MNVNSVAVYTYERYLVNHFLLPLNVLSQPDELIWLSFWVAIFSYVLLIMHMLVRVPRIVESGMRVLYIDQSLTTFKLKHSRTIQTWVLKTKM